MRLYNRPENAVPRSAARLLAALLCLAPAWVAAQAFPSKASGAKVD